MGTRSLGQIIADYELERRQALPAPAPEHRFTVAGVTIANCASYIVLADQHAKGMTLTVETSHRVFAKLAGMGVKVI